MLGPTGNSADPAADGTGSFRSMVANKAPALKMNNFEADPSLQRRPLLTNSLFTPTNYIMRNKPFMPPNILSARGPCPITPHNWTNVSNMMKPVDLQSFNNNDLAEDGDQASQVSRPFTPSAASAFKPVVRTPRRPPMAMHPTDLTKQLNLAALSKRHSDSPTNANNFINSNNPYSSCLNVNNL